MVEYIGYVIISIGIFFAITSAVGLFRFRDPYSSLHVTSVNDMLAVPLILLGTGLLMYYDGLVSAGNKTIVAIISIYIAAPVSSYVMVKICYFVKSFPIEQYEN